MSVVTEPGVPAAMPMPAPAARRAGAAIAGVAVAIGSAFMSFGGSLIAVLAIGIAWLIARRRGRPFTRGVSWLVGVGAVGAALLVAFGTVATRLPASAFSDFRRAMDSTRAAPPPPPPEWLRRITPPNAQQQAPLTNAFVKSRAFTVWAAAMGVTFVVGLLAAYAGSLGWGASILLLYAATGRWLPKAAPSGST